MFATKNHYECKPLDHFQDEIRLMALSTGMKEDKIICNSSHDLSDQPRYEALSYTWGVTTELQTITLNGLPFQITCNLEVTLRHLRDHLGGVRILWIDAVCINQIDVKERSAQVQMMSKIFGLAWQRERRQRLNYVLH